MEILLIMQQKKWAIYFVIVLVFSINPICAVEMGIESDTDSNLNQGTGNTIENNSNENIIPSSAVESPMDLPDNHHKGAVESPKLYINPSNNDIEGHHPETHTGYGQDLDPWPAIIFVTDIVTIVIGAVVAVKAGNAALRIASYHRKLAQIRSIPGWDFIGEQTIRQIYRTENIQFYWYLIKRESGLYTKLKLLLKISISLTILTSLGVPINSNKRNMYNSWTH